MRSKTVRREDVRGAARALGLSGRPLVVHSSLRSFGRVEGGAQTIVDGLLAEGCTVIVPTFSWNTCIVDPLPHRQHARNGMDDSARPLKRTGAGRVYRPDTTPLDRREMGAIPAAVLAMPERVRGHHPLCSFSAVGPLAQPLIARQAPLRVNGALEALVEADGAVVLMGVGLDSMTLLHLAEQRAGRRMFRRWAAGPDGQPVEVESGGCSDGFPNLESVLAPVRREIRLGQSTWHAYDAQGAVQSAVEAIRRRLDITHCDRDCCRCDDAIQGGPILI